MRHETCVVVQQFIQPPKPTLISPEQTVTPFPSVYLFIIITLRFIKNRYATTLRNNNNDKIETYTTFVQIIALVYIYTQTGVTHGREGSRFEMIVLKERATLSSESIG